MVRIPGPRYERSSPNELWHIDLKGPFYLHPLHGSISTCHFLALVDDHSRYLLGIRALPTKEAVPVLETLAEAIELCGVPLALMSDNGTPFVTIVRTMLSRFQRSLAELEIRHIRTQVDTPWTNGKDVHLCQAASQGPLGAEQCAGPEHRPEHPELGPGEGDDRLMMRLALAPLTVIEASRRRRLEAPERGRPAAPGGGEGCSAG